MKELVYHRQLLPGLERNGSRVGFHDDDRRRRRRMRARHRQERRDAASSGQIEVAADFEHDLARHRPAIENSRFSLGCHPRRTSNSL